MNTNENPLSEPLKISRSQIEFAIAFIKGLALILILSGLLGLVGCSSDTPKLGNWHSAERHPEQLLAQVIAENSSDSTLDSSQLKSLEITNKLTLFKFDTPEFCGQLGCLHTAYLETSDRFQQVWARYLDPYLPKDTPQIRLVKEAPNGKVAQSSLPCLQFVQMSSVKHLLNRTTECFDGQGYQIVDRHNLLVINHQ